MTEEEKEKRGLPRLLLILALSGLAIFAVCGTLAVFTGWPAYVTVLAGAVLYVCACAVIILLSLREAGDEDGETENDIQRSIADVLKRIGMPVVITTPDGKLVWINLEFKRLFGVDSPIGRNIEELAGCGMEVISTADPSLGTPVTLGGVPYRAVCSIKPAGERDFWMTVFVDSSELEEARRDLAAETAVIAYAAVDNLDSLSSLVKISYREAVLRVDATLREWAAEHGGFLREYEGDK
ncbi:MAG: hypothetical protein J6V01_01230, partial [Clostridia bacterium]|nr:hypothetical protein [Clostridia bacterium]